MGAIFQSLGRTITAGVVLLVVLLIIVAAAGASIPAGTHAWWLFAMRWLHVLAGVWIWHGRTAGKLLAPIMLAFGALMAASIGGMMVVMQVTGAAPAATPVAIAMFVVAGCAVAVLARLLRARFTPVFATR